MKTISSYYNDMCTQKYQTMGFYRKNSTCIRIHNDILQIFSFKHAKRGFLCTVEFGIIPLCAPPIYMEVCEYDLDKFFVKETETRWMFNEFSKDSMMSCVNSISQAIDMHIIPFFEACRNCESALSELMKLEELFEFNRLKWLKLMGTSDSAAMTWQERSLLDEKKYFIALKTNNFSYARKYLINHIELNKNTLKKFHASDSYTPPESVIERCENNLAIFIKQLEKLDSGDFAYFEKIINSNEKQMHKALLGKYPKMFID